MMNLNNVFIPSNNEDISLEIWAKRIILRELDICIELYILSHVFVYMTSCLGIMDNILKTSDYNLYIVCNKNQNDFARIYLAEYKDRLI